MAAFDADIGVRGGIRRYHPSLLVYTTQLARSTRVLLIATAFHEAIPNSISVFGALILSFQLAMGSIDVPHQGLLVKVCEPTEIPGPSNCVGGEIDGASSWLDGMRCCS